MRIEKSINRERITNAQFCARKLEQQYAWVLALGSDQGRRAIPLPDAYHSDGQWAAVANAAGTLLLVAGYDGRAVLWRLADDIQWVPELLSEPPAGAGNEAAILCAALDRSERYLVMGTRGGKLRLWRDEGEGFQEQSVLLENDNPIRAVAFSPDGQNLVVGDDNGFLWRWDMRQGAPEPRGWVSAHTGTLYTIAFSDDGHMVTGGSDGRVYVWLPGHFGPRERLMLEGSRDEVVAAIPSPSGKLVVAGDADGYLHLWELGLEKLVMRACEVMTRNLSWAEWERYVSKDSYECACPGLEPGAGVPPDLMGRHHGCGDDFAVKDTRIDPGQTP